MNTRVKDIGCPSEAISELLAPGCPMPPLENGFRPCPLLDYWVEPCVKQREFKVKVSRSLQGVKLRLDGGLAKKSWLHMRMQPARETEVQNELPHGTPA